MGFLYFFLLSEFIQAITNILKAYECLLTSPDKAIDHCTNAGNLMENFMNSMSCNQNLKLIQV